MKKNPKNMKNFIILGTQRTGSSAIAKFINLHRNILCGLEWTNSIPSKKKIITAKRLLSGDFKSLQGPAQKYVDKKKIEEINWIGFKILFSSSNKWIFHPKYSIALWADVFNGHLKWLKNNPDIHVIHIVRNDNIEWLKSLFLAKETKIYSGQKYPDGVRIKIKVNNAISRIKSKNWLDSCINLLEKTNPYCQVTYEHFQHEKTKVAQKLFQFLNCDNEINIKEFNSIKQSKGHPKDYIRNYYEVFEALERKQILFSNPVI